MTYILVTYAVNGVDFNGDTYNTVAALVKVVSDDDFIKNKCVNGNVKINHLRVFDYTDYCSAPGCCDQYTNYTALKGTII